jgi:RHS repeat-associated protein
MIDGNHPEVNPVLRRLLLLRPFLVIGGLWLLGAPSPARAQFPNVARGFSPSGMFDLGGIDVVNGFNGNLVIKIPIGRSYPVGGIMGTYSFTLIYNSKAWDYVGHQGPACSGNAAPTDTLAVASPYDNAGLGWRFSLGRLGPDLLPYDAPPPPSALAYRGLDGSEHYLFDQLATPQGGTVQQSGMKFSNDGSYLRYQPASGSDLTTGMLELPDGAVHVFAGGYPTSITDQFGNGLTINYRTDPQTCPGNVWQISDGYRTHKVCFKPTTYTAPEQTEVIDYIDVAEFGVTSTYKFLYNDTDVNGDGFHTINLTGYGTKIRGCNDPPWQPRVYLLTGLLLPDGTSYSMPSANYIQPPDPTNGTPEFQGVLTAMTVPTSGSIAWHYELKSLPQPHNEDSSLWYVAVMSSVVGVKLRSLHDSAGQLIGTWQYSGATGVTPLANEVINQVLYPSPDPSLAAQGASGHRIVTYYSGCVYGACLNEAGVQDTFAADYGLPLSRRRPDGTGRFMSQEIYASATASTPLRQVYVNYENDSAVPPPADAASPVFLNQRSQAQRTVFLDDILPGSSGTYASVFSASSSYDGFGHYRTVTMSDNFGFQTLRTETTDWNTGSIPAPTAHWILDTYDYKEQQEGSAVEHQEFLFDRSTGFLQCQRHYKTGATIGANDVVVTYDLGNPQIPGQAGQVAAEHWYGGDTQAVSTAPGCQMAQVNPTFSYTHSYSAGVRNLTTTVVTVNGIATTLKLLDEDVDAASGLVKTSRDPAGRPTVFTYDSMGRPLITAPAGDAAAQVTYHLTPGSPPFVERSVGSPVLEDETWQLDALGRIVQHAVALPSSVSTSVVTLNALGWKIFETEPAASPGANRTQYLSYDPFGRPGEILAADGKRTYVDHHGIRVVIRNQPVWDGTRESPVNTREEYDGLGRLLRVQDPTGIWTRYRYDAGGRLKTVTTNGTQTRTFRYDGRGFLNREQQPESGVTSYRYDAKGNAVRKATPTGTMLSQYDEASRLLSVSSPQGTLKQFSYFGPGSAAGKLKEASAFNWRMGSVCGAFEVRQDFFYDSTTGRLSTENTSLWNGPDALEQWTQSYAYDGAGRVTQVYYPSCTAVCSSPPRQVTTAYSMGRPTSVSGFASAITYHDNGTLFTVQHANHVVFTETADPHGMARPGALQADSPTGQPWPLEYYFYDGAGNIKAIGGKSFAYDANSRIASATVPAALTLPYQAYSYDIFGNLATLSRGTTPADASYISFDVDPATNRLLGASYDPSGHLTGYQGNSYTSYTWDVLGQVTSANNGSELWIHTYDAAGERVWSWRTSPSRLDNYSLRGLDDRVLSEFTKIGTTYTWEDYAYREGRLLGAALSSGPVTHFDVDHLGSVRLETDANAMATYHDFYPFGDEATPLSGSERMKFTGQERDLGNLTSIADDLDYLHARYYRPLYGRFLSPDPTAGDPKVPQSWNGYAYAAGNPMKHVDPTGQSLDQVDTAKDKVDSWIASLNSSFLGGLLGSVTGALPVLSGVSAALDTLKVGEGTATAIGEGQSTLGVALGVGKDAMRALTIAGVLGGVSGLASDALAGGASLARGGAAPVELGQAGEAAVRAVADIGPKEAIVVAGRTRVPDGLTPKVVTEIKNVKSLSLTRQLRDFLAFAGQTGRTFDLWVRPSTQLSGPLNNAVTAGLINLRYIPGP